MGSDDGSTHRLGVGTALLAFDGECVEDAAQRADSSWVVPTHPGNSE